MIKDIKTTWFARNTNLLCTALFGLLPAIFLDTQTQYDFYTYILILSWMSIATFSVEAFANIRFPKRKQKYVSLSAYLLPVTISSAIGTLFLLTLKMDVFDTELLIIIFLGNILNIKLLYLSWVRAYFPNRANVFMFVDGFTHLIASVILYFYNDVTISLVLIFIIAKVTPFLMVIWDIVLLNVKLRFTKFRKIQIKIIFISSLKLFASSVFLVYGMTALKTIMFTTYTEAQFVAASIALSVTANIQKVILTYYWVLQKHVFSGSIAYKLNIKYAINAALNVLAVILLTVLILRIIQNYNPSLTFGAEILFFCIIISFHRIIVSSYRLHVLQRLGVHKTFNYQTASLIVNGFFIGLAIFGSYDLQYIIPVLLIIDLLITCILPLSGFFSVIRINR